ncbi:MAG: transglycosylase domain-containing protein, partial [Streptosporangiaceae bacterium]
MHPPHPPQQPARPPVQPPAPPVVGGLNALQSLGRPVEAPGAPGAPDYGGESAYGPPTAYGPPPSYEFPDGPGTPGGPAGPGDQGPGGGGGGGFGGPEDPDDSVVVGRRRKPTTTGWKRYLPNWKIVVGVITLGILGVTALITVAYMNTDVPNLKASQVGVKDQGTTVYEIKNGKNSPLFRLGEPRENVEYKNIPDVVKNAVMAAEQRDFMTDPGVSPKGLTRAVWKSATGGDVTGGSTITQQVARNYFQGLSQERTLSRKFKEIFVAVKLDKEMSKEDILELYLNTIYYGRQANGIQAASRAYLGKDVQKINSPSEAALLATVLNRPDWFHTQGSPAKDPQRAATESRWNYVLDGMVTKGWLSAAERTKQKFPKTIKSGSYNKDKGQNSYIRDRVLTDLAKAKLTEKDITTGGYKVSTSIDHKLMAYARAAVLQAGPAKSSIKKTDRIGLVAVNPEDGTVPAFYGGNPFKDQADAAFFDTAQVGSSFKPFVLAEALHQGYNAKSMIDAALFRCFKVDGSWVQGITNERACGNKEGYRVNGDGRGGVLSLIDAMAISQNVSYVRLNLLLGPENVAKMAASLGVPRASMKGQESGGLALGISSYPAVYQASGYAAFANGGKAVNPHLVTKVTHLVDGKEVKVKLPWDDAKPKRVLEEDAAAQVTA